MQTYFTSHKCTMHSYKNNLYSSFNFRILYIELNMKQLSKLYLTKVTSKHRNVNTLIMEIVQI